MENSEPFSAELLNKSNEEMAKPFKGFNDLNDEKIFNWYGGLYGSFRQTVAKNYQKFSKNLNPFLSINPQFQYAFLSGLLEASEKNPILYVMN